MRKGKFLLISTLIATVFTSTTVFAGENQGKVINGRTMIPLRGAFTDLGFDVSWDGATNTATLKNDEHVIKVKKDDVNFTVDGVTYTSDVAPTAIDGSIYIPLRSIGDKIGAEVDYNKEFEMASIVYDEAYSYIYLGTIPKITKSNYVNEGSTVFNIIDMEDVIIDEFNEAIGYAEEGDLASAYDMFEVAYNDLDYLVTSDFDSLSPSIQENVYNYTYNTSAIAVSYMEAIEAYSNDDLEAAYEALEYCDMYTVMSNLYYDALVDFYNAAY